MYIKTTYNVERDDKFPNDGLSWPVKLLPDRSLHRDIIIMPKPRIEKQRESKLNQWKPIQSRQTTKQLKGIRYFSTDMVVV